MAVVKRINHFNQSSKKSYLWLWVLLAVLILGVGYILYHQYYDKNTQTVTVYIPQDKVNKNRYFAAEHILNNQTHVFHSSQDSKKIKDLLNESSDSAKNHVLMFYDFNSKKDSDHDAILSWVSRGGHLILFSQMMLNESNADKYQQHQNPLLIKLGITYKYIKNNATSAKAIDFYANAIPIRLSDGRTLFIDNTSDGVFGVDDFLLKYSGEKLYNYSWFYENAQGAKDFILPIDTGLTDGETQKIKLAANQGYDFSPNKELIDMSFGEGRISVLADKNIFTNPSSYPAFAKQAQIQKQEQLTNTTDKDENRPSQAWQTLKAALPKKIPEYVGGIAEADHAYLLKILVEDKEVYFIPDVHSVNLLAILWENMRWTVMGLIFLMILTLLALPKRFGMPKSYKTDTSYNIFGFFGHVGRYLWASDGAFELLTTNRESFIQMVIAKEQLIDSTPAKMIEILTIRTNLSKHLIGNALYDTWNSDDEFLQISRNFARLVRSYH